MVKNLTANAGVRDEGLIPGSGRSSGLGNGNPLQYSGLENPMDRGAWQAMVHAIVRVRHDLGTKQQQQSFPENLDIDFCSTITSKIIFQEKIIFW